MLLCLVFRCASLSVSPHTELNDTKAAYGTHVQVSCHHGYTFDGPIKTVVTKCTENGTWSISEIPNCIGTTSVFS